MVVRYEWRVRGEMAELYEVHTGKWEKVHWIDCESTFWARKVVEAMNAMIPKEG